MARSTSLRSRSDCRPGQLVALGAPDRRRSLASYSSLAASYEAETRGIEAARVDALFALGLRSGDVVVDVGCGTGSLLPRLARLVGTGGRVIGIEQCPAMAVRAQRAAAPFPWVDVLVAPAEEVDLEFSVDALLFCFAHDVLQTPPALSRLFAHVRGSARVVTTGLALMGWWAAPINLWSGWRARRYLTTWRGLRRPWQGLLPYCPDLRVFPRYFPGTRYLAIGHATGTPTRDSPITDS